MISFNVERFVNENFIEGGDHVSFIMDLVMENIDMNMYIYDQYHNTIVNESYITEGSLGDFFGNIIKFIKEIIKNFFKMLKSVKDGIMSLFRKYSSSSVPQLPNFKEMTPEQRDEYASNQKVTLYSLNTDVNVDIEKIFASCKFALNKINKPIDAWKKEDKEKIFDPDYVRNLANGITTTVGDFDIYSESSYLKAEETTLKYIKDNLDIKKTGKDITKQSFDGLTKISDEFDVMADECLKHIEDDRKYVETITDPEDKKYITNIVSVRAKLLNTVNKVVSKIIAAHYRAISDIAKAYDNAFSKCKQIYG